MASMSKRVSAPAPDDGYEAAIFSAEIGSCPTLDLHGAYHDDIEGEIDRFLFRESQRGTDAVKVIHGKGTQQLRKQVASFLATHPLVGRARLSQNPSEANAVTYIAIVRKHL